MIARRPLIFADGHVEWRQVEPAARFIEASAEPIDHHVDSFRFASGLIPRSRLPARVIFESMWFRSRWGAGPAQAFVERGTTRDIMIRAFVDLVVPVLEIAPQRGGP